MLNKKNVLVLGIGYAVSLVAVMSCGLVLLWFIYWRKKESGRIEDFIDDMCMDYEICVALVPRGFTYLELSRATNKFVEEGKLWRCLQGVCYVNPTQKLLLKRSQNNQNREKRSTYQK